MPRTYVTHGQCVGGASREYKSWYSMIQRCTNPKNRSYPDYGARGITVCFEWRKFEAFFADMGKKPSLLHSLDRKDNSKGYCKENCRWATKTVQNRNARRNRLLTFRGTTMCVSAWEEHLGFTPETIRQRLDKCHWSIEKALTAPQRNLTSVVQR